MRAERVAYAQPLRPGGCTVEAVQPVSEPDRRPVEPSADAPAVERGSLVCYRMFDIAEEVDLDKLLVLLRGREARRTSMSGRHERLFQLSAAPVWLDLGERDCPPLAPFGKVCARAQFFNYGVVSVSFEVPLPPRALGDFTSLSATVLESAELTALGRTIVKELASLAEPSFQCPHEVDDFETFTLFFIRELRGGAGSKALLEWEDLGKLLSGETARGKLHAWQREDLLGYAYSYLEDDLVVIDYNAALVLEPSGTREIPLLLEFANTQLLALRYYDRALDEDLRRIYDELEKLERKRPRRKKRYDVLAHQVLRRSVEVREFSDLIGNSIKLVGDFYLARTYRGALRRLRIADWQESIAKKLTLASEVYALLKGELEHARSFFLEVLVVLLILFEVVLVFFGH